MPRRIVLFSMMSLTLPAVAAAATIVSQTSSSQGVLSGTIAAQWTQTDTWTNVSVSAEVATNNGSGSTVSTFLNHNGTAIGNQVATVVAPAPAGISTQVLFTGLTLPPGTYQLTFDPADGLTGMLGGGAPTNTTAPGVVFTGIFTLGAAAYPPQGAPTPLSSAIRFIVTGDLQPEADLVLAKTLTTAGTIPVGTNVVFALTATNNGPSNATGVTVTDSLPAGLTYVSNDCGATFASPTLTWNIGALALSASVTCNLTVTVTQGGVITNTSGVTAIEADPTSANNSAQASVTVAQSMLAIPTLDSAGLVALIALLALSAAFALRGKHRA